MQRTQLQTSRADVTLVAIPQTHETRRPPTRTRVYGAFTLHPDLERACDAWTSPNVEAVTATFERENPTRAALIKREYSRTRREAVATTRATLNELLASAKLPVKVKMFSIKAGCSCGCSPGFVLDGMAYVDDHAVDLYVKVEDTTS